MGAGVAKVSSTDLFTLAQTLWGEARGEGIQGLEAVAWVIRNRHEIHPRWKGLPIFQVCKAPYQFSCWLQNDPNYPKMLGLSTDDALFVECLISAAEVLGGQVVNPVGLSTHYYAKGTPEPKWAIGKTPFVTIGHHMFYEHIA